MDVAHERGDMAVSDPLYATESAGMVGTEGHGDEPVEDVDAVNGEDGGEEGTQEAGAGGLLTETERKPVLVVDVPAAAGSAAPEHAEAESNKVEENHVNAEPGRKNNESDHGVVPSDKEIQNNVPGDMEESSEEHEGDGAPVVDQPNNTSEMLPQTGEQFPDSGNSPDSNLEAASLGNVDQGARYRLPPLDKGRFQVADLVWGKVKSHPWWPGEIFDPTDASELALKHRKKGSHLVAYFGDSTFAWCDESQLKPFVTNYSQMEKQSSSDGFVGSVNNALEELSRRVLSGLSCSCLAEELADNGMSYTVDNAGLKDGVTCSAVNRPEILNCFSPENLLNYIKELALFPGQGGDLLELVIACSQLTSFYRSKGCPELASFQTSDAWVEDDLDGIDTLSTQNVMVEEPVINEVQPTQDKPKRGRGRPRKQKAGHDQVVMEKRSTSNQVNDTSYNEKKRNLKSFEDSEKSSAPTGGGSFKIGECIRRAASQLTGSSSIMKANNAAEGENGEFDVSSDDAGDELTVEKRAKRRRLHINHAADPRELLSQLCLVATEPMNGYSFSAMIIGYFNDYRNYIVSTTTEANIVDKGTSRRGRKRKEVIPSPEVETTDHMQDSYWSGLSLYNHPVHDLKRESPTTRPRRKRRSSRHAYIPLSELGEPVPKKQIQVMERSIIHVDEKMVDELKPTALVLTFGRSASIPSELDLVKMFSLYGPLKERGTKVHRETNTVKVVFKKRVDAERAFSAAGKYSTFGPSLRSYRLVSMPLSPETQSANNPENHGLETLGLNMSEAPKDSMEVDLVQKTDKVKVTGELSSEEVETVRQTCLVEAADSTFVSEVDRLEKAGNIDAELIVHVNQIGEGAEAASVSEESSQQVGDIEQAYTQKAASVSDLPTEIETLHSDAIIKELPQKAPDNMQTDIATAPKQSHNPGDNAVFEAVTEVPSTAQDHSEDDVGDEVPEEHTVFPVLQSQTPGEKLVGQSETEQKVGPEDPKSQAENLTVEPVVQGAVEQVEIELESKTTVEVSCEQGYSIEQTVNMEAVIEASGGQLEVGRRISEDESMADANIEHSMVMVDETVEAKVVPLEESTENNAATIGVVEETAEGETKEEAPDEKGKIENNEDADKLAGETRAGEITVEAPDEKTEIKADADTPAGETKECEITVEAPDEKIANKGIVEPIIREITEDQTAAGEPDEEATTTEETVEDVKVLDDKSTADGKPVENATVATNEDSTTVENTLKDAMVAPPGTNTTNAEETALGATVKALDEDALAVEKTIEDTSVEASDVQAGRCK
ncbi:Putative PWWP domain family protein [Zea mays]|uniref:Putative PWWP domain family protein n=1 Tax=Zea mays TaxID=4577 RepID=A0A1D6M650_MAIZE|nr:Putative PWWP domain family protein [Zea mays]